MKLLLTNDDGINSIGLHMLIKEMEKNNDVLIVAPDNQRSACGHSITIHRPIIVREVSLREIKSKAFQIDGTPADCVKFGVQMLLNGKVDMIISGINRGFNLGTDVIYSGTVSAAVEAAILKIPSMAVSTDITDEEIQYAECAKYAAQILKNSQKNISGRDIVLNVNVPLPKEWVQIKGIKVCQLGSRIYNNYYINANPSVQDEGFILHGEPDDCVEEGTDVRFIKDGYVTVTPLHYDLTNFSLLKEIDRWF